MSSALLRTVLVSLCLTIASRAMDQSGRREHLEWVQKNLPPVPYWTEWQQKTGALPPDFDALPAVNQLPAPLRFAERRKVQMPADWPARRTHPRMHRDAPPEVVRGIVAQARQNSSPWTSLTMTSGSQRKPTTE